MDHGTELRPRGIAIVSPLYEPQESLLGGSHVQPPKTPTQLPLANSKDLMSELQLQMDFFRKLGYSPRQIHTAMDRLGMGTDTNTVLAELVRTETGTGDSPTPERDREKARDRERVRSAGSSSGSAGSTTASAAGIGSVFGSGCGDGSMPGSVRGKSPVKNPQNQHHQQQQQQQQQQHRPVSEEEEDSDESEDELKPIVIDGSNVAMSHGNKEVFSCRGIELAVNYFLKRGHKKITVFVPSWRKEPPRPDVPITDQLILSKLEKRKIVVFTPSRRVAGKRVVCYDDRFIVRLAHELDGVIVSNDTYRDLQSENPEWKKFIEGRLLMYSFVNDKFMPPDDPLGRHGPNLDNLLRKKPLQPEHKRQSCPYGKKCTYGVKCKFHHPERASQSQRALADELRDNAKLSSTSSASAQKGRGGKGACQAPVVGPALSSSSSPAFGCDSPSLEQQLQSSLTLEASGQSQVGETAEDRWDLSAVAAGAMTGAGYSRPSSSSSCGSPGLQSSGQEWLSLLSPFSTDPASMFISKDSGLGSYEYHQSQQHHHHHQKNPQHQQKQKEHDHHHHHLNRHAQHQHQQQQQQQQQQQHYQQRHQQQQQQQEQKHPKDRGHGQGRRSGFPSLVEATHPCLGCCVHHTTPPPPPSPQPPHPALHAPSPAAGTGHPRAAPPHPVQSYCLPGCNPTCPSMSCGYNGPQYPPQPPHPSQMHHTSLPSYFPLGPGGSRLKYQSEPPPWMPGGSFTPCSLPESIHPASMPLPGHGHGHGHGLGYYYPEQQIWAPPVPPGYPCPQTTGRMDPEMEDVRKKLHAIFNPYQVDKVMSMYPHVRDAQKLAAEIVTLKSRGEIL